MSIIYKTTNLVNKKIYVGQHYTSADDGYLGSGLYFKSIIKEFGKQNFKREILEFCEKQNLNRQEKYWILELSANNPEIGYNKTVGGQCGWVGKNHPMFGKHHSKKAKKQQSKLQKGEKKPFLWQITFKRNKTKNEI